MPITYISSPLSKGLFILILIFIVIEYFFGTITYTKTTLFLPNNSTNKYDFSMKNRGKDTDNLHGPLLKSLLKRNQLFNQTRNSISNSSLNTNTTGNTSVNVTNFLVTSSPIVDIGTTVLNVVLNVTLMPLCPDISPDLRGRIEVIKSPVPTIQQLEYKLSWLKPGGHWAPSECRVEKTVAIIIPFRCRGAHLLLFLQHMHPFLKRQQIDYTIFIIEQDGDGPFNRATLMNVGYKEALRLRNYDCFIFHDVDLLPEDDRNLYTCPEQPRHMSVAVDIFKYRLPYREIFGGVSAITRDHFRLLNGFSNSFWGWGGEDDDMANRIKHHHLFISRYPINIARYTMLSHKKDKPSPNRYEVLKHGKERYDKDGLNNLRYQIVQMKQNLLYTWLLVKVKTPS